MNPIDCVECIKSENYLEKKEYPFQTLELGLSSIKYRIGMYSDFRKTIFKNLNTNHTLSSWTYRESDDPGIALLDGACVLADILAFYQQVYANEVYLKTAKNDSSIFDLIRILDYRPAPGLGGNGVFAFQVDSDVPVLINKGFQMKSELENSVQAEFETTEDIVAFPWLNNFHLYRPLASPTDNSKINEFYFEYDDEEFVAGKFTGDLSPGKFVNELISNKSFSVNDVKSKAENTINKFGDLHATVFGSAEKLFIQRNEMMTNERNQLITKFGNKHHRVIQMQKQLEENNF
ncbi:MAG: hypothetical protein HRO68_06120 [Nitrosopumilus sp.]|nr:hypothetical protein [Nitrosopumilus sp.]